MDRETLMKRLCAITSMVADRKFGWSEAADCFCCEEGRDRRLALLGNHTTSEKVVEYIESAVSEALRKEEA